MALPEAGYTQPVEIVVGGTLPRSGWVQPVDIVSSSGVSMSIGGLVVGGTPGSVLFVDAAGNLGQNNPVFFWDDPNKLLLINSINPFIRIKSTTAGNCNLSLFHTGQREWLMATDAGSGGNLRIGFGPGNATIASQWLRCNGTTTYIYFNPTLAVLVTGTPGTEMVYRFAPDPANSVCSMELYRLVDALDNPVNFERLQFISDQAAINTFTIRSFKGGTGTLRDIQFSIGLTETARIQASSFFWGFNQATPRQRVDILDAANPQLRCTFTDNAVYSDFQTDASGFLNINATGGATKFFNKVGSAVAAVGVWNGGAAYGCFAYATLITSTTDYALVQGSGGDTYLNAKSGQAVTFRISNADSFQVDANQIFISKIAMATNMTKGFMNIPGAAGPPVGVPATVTGYPLYWDHTNLKLYVYDAGWKKGQVAAVDVVYA